jgi:hypothetical protein
MTVLTGIQVIGLIFALVMMYLIFLNFKRQEVRVGEFIFWIAVWCGFIALIFLPRLVRPLLESLHIVRALDLFIIVGFMFLIAFHFVTYRIVRKNQRKVELLVQRLAFKEEKERKKR